MAEVNADLITEQNEKFKRATGNTAFLKQVSYRIPVTAPAIAGVSAGDELAIFQLPVGCTVRPELSTVTWSGASSITTSSAVTLGDVADPDRYMVTEDVTANQAPQNMIHTATKPAGYSTPYVVPAADAEVAGEDNGRLLLSLVSVGGGSWAAGESIGEIVLVVDLP
jgi:hypothetical protein